MIGEEDRHTLKALHRALCMGCVLFLLVLAFLNHTNGAEMNPAPTFLVPFGLSSLLLLVPAFVLFNQRLARMRAEVPNEPFATLRAALIIHWALIEVSCFVTGVVFLLTGSWLVFCAALFAVATLAARAPTATRVAFWLTGMRG